MQADGRASGQGGKGNVLQALVRLGWPYFVDVTDEGRIDGTVNWLCAVSGYGIWHGPPGHVHHGGGYLRGIGSAGGSDKIAARRSGREDGIT